MIFTLAQINTIWLDKTADLDKIYLCDDMFRYKGLADGTLTRILTGNLDDYKAELRRQQLAVAQEEYDQQQLFESLALSVTNINTQIININSLTADDYGYSIKDAPYNWNNDDLVVKVTAEGATQRISSASGYRGKEIMIINASRGTVRVNSSLDQTIGNSAIFNPIYFDLYSEEVLSLKSDNANWNII